MAAGTRSPGLDAEGAGGLGVLQGRGEAPGVLQGEAHPQHHEPVGVLLEAAVAVGEAALLVGERDGLAGAAVVGDDLGDRGGDLLAVRAHVLDRGGARRAGDAGQALHTGQSGLDRTGDRVGPVLARGEREVRAVEREAAGGDAQGRAVEALVADDEVAAAADDQQRGPGLVGRADRRDDLVVGGGRDEAGCRAAEAEGGQRGEGRVVEFLHAPKGTGTVRQRSAGRPRNGWLRRGGPRRGTCPAPSGLR